MQCRFQPGPLSKPRTSAAARTLKEEGIKQWRQAFSEAWCVSQCSGAGVMEVVKQ